MRNEANDNNNVKKLSTERTETTTVKIYKRERV